MVNDENIHTGMASRNLSEGSPPRSPMRRETTEGPWNDTRRSFGPDDAKQEVADDQPDLDYLYYDSDDNPAHLAKIKI